MLILLQLSHGTADAMEALIAALLKELNSGGACLVRFRRRKTQARTKTPKFLPFVHQPVPLGPPAPHAPPAADPGSVSLCASSPMQEANGVSDTKEITGGKFANGATTASLAQAVNGNDDVKRRVAAQKGTLKRFQDILKKGNIDLDENIAEAESMSFEDWEAAVKTNGKWDYKNQLSGLEIDSKLLDDFGNYHFGIVAAAHGFNLEGSMYGAGANQVLRQGGGTPSHLYAATHLMWVTKGGYLLPDSAARSVTNSGFTWGDNPGDSINIMKGWDYYHDSR